jgi:hypothetical protein
VTKFPIIELTKSYREKEPHLQEMPTAFSPENTRPRKNHPRGRKISGKVSNPTYIRTAKNSGVKSLIRDLEARICKYSSGRVFRMSPIKGIGVEFTLMWKTCCVKLK